MFPYTVANLLLKFRRHAQALHLLLALVVVLTTSLQSLFAEQQTLVKTLLQQGQKPEMKPVPPSQLLGRLQTFLPALKAANADLASRPAEEVCLEHTGAL